jgi:hypothetical protein
MDGVLAMWIVVAAYIVAQCYTLIAWRGGWWMASAVPLLGMVPITVIAFRAFSQSSNLWPILLLFAGPFALLYLIVLIAFRAKRKNVS